MKARALLLLLILVSAAHAEPYRPLDHLWMGTRDIPETQNYIVLGVGTALTIGALVGARSLDDSVHEFFAGQERMGSYAKIGNDFLGTGIPGVLAGLGVLGYGLLKNEQHEIDAGESHLEGLAASAAYTNLLKYTVHRQRPDGGNHLSFPSGHTSTTFTSAANLMDMYGAAFGVPALVLAGFTGVCRLDVDAHHLSDVIFGAALGYTVGHAYTRHHLGRAGGVSVLPFYDDRSNFGINLRIALR